MTVFEWVTILVVVIVHAAGAGAIIGYQRAAMKALHEKLTENSSRLVDHDQRLRYLERGGFPANREAPFFGHG